MTFLSAGLFVPMISTTIWAQARGCAVNRHYRCDLSGWPSRSWGCGSKLTMGSTIVRRGARRKLCDLDFAGANYTVLVIFTVCMGTAYGGWIALSAVTAYLFGPVGLGGVLGALYTSAGIGGLVGPPVIGVVIDSTNYETAIGLAIVFSAISLVLLRTATRASAPTTADAVESDDDVQPTGAAASAWLVPSPQGGMRLIRR